ncbi:hypothetical protein GCM10009838_58340 [Catenulispora subtropica]|uniref:DUF4352 domain-containing protein n=2 Tax=Catenulispora subtropica TaxID=450798 RepID=A0ABP5DYS9_9ACTN
MFLAGILALSAAACASQGSSAAGGTATTSGAAGTTTTVSGSASGSAPSSSTTAEASQSSSSADTGAASSSSSAPASPADGDSTGGALAATNKLTDTVTQGGFRFKIHSVSLPYAPPAGTSFPSMDPLQWMMMDFEATNVTDGELPFSTIGAFDVFDSEKNHYQASIVGWEALPKDKRFPEDDFKPGQTMSGEIMFLVPKDAKGLLLQVNGNMFHQSGPKPVLPMGR